MRTVTLLLCTPVALAAQERLPTPVRQAQGAVTAPVAISLRDASRHDRWLGLGPRDVRWGPDGRHLYFRWSRRPTATDLPESDPWFRADSGGRWIEAVRDDERGEVPGDAVAWNPARTQAAWVAAGAVYLWGPTTRRVAALPVPATELRFAESGAALHFMAGEALYRYGIADGALTIVAARVTVEPPAVTPAGRHLADETAALSQLLRDRLQAARQRAALVRRDQPVAIPAPPGTRVEQIQLTPDGTTLTFRLRTVAANRPRTRYMDYVDPSGYARALEAREKVGEPRDRFRLGVMDARPGVAPESVVVRWLELPEAHGQGTVTHGPYWSPDGSRAVVQYVGEQDRDLWIAALDPALTAPRVIAHEHDDAWLGGPPIQSNYTEPTLLVWLDGRTFVYASERDGWSHLWKVEGDGAPVPLTSGAWEVRGAELSPDRSTWLLQASRDSAWTDHLYTMPARGGALTRVTTAGGRNAGTWSPDGRRLAVLRSSATALPDLFLRRTGVTAEQRLTESGTDDMRRRRLLTPEIVAIPHPDGKPVYAALYRPARPTRERAALVHVHGGGYRQFAHLGWSVYGWSGHLGLLHHFVEQGYTVLDFDYRGSAGFGRDYRTDITMAMGQKDVDGAVAAARWLVRTQGIDSTRIGIYGVSYGGFMTLMSLFRYPGIFAAGVSRAPVTDWAHYSDAWTSRILGVPQVDSAAYRRSSPIYHAAGLRDALLLEHGLVDDNVHFQDTARLVQRLLELEKAFDVMYYPMEPHVVESEVARYDQVRRASAFFERHLVRRGGRYRVTPSSRQR